MTTRIAAVVALAALGFVGSTAPAGAQEEAPVTCPSPPKAMTFDPQGYVDRERAGGEPTVEQHPDGTLLYGGHAGTTHFYAPAAADPDSAAFVRHYTGQTYIWWSDDRGTTWNFVPRTDFPRNVPGSGFSDPDWAIDTAGNTYASEINLVNVAVSKSEDSGRSFTLQNFFAQTMTDRQWKAADLENHVYIVGNAFAGGTFPSDPVGNLGHHLYKSVDGGKTFTPGLADGDGLGDIQVDHRDGTLYEAYYDGDTDTPDTLSMAAYRDIRAATTTLAGQKPDINPIAQGVAMLSHWPSLDVDSLGNVYITWDESGRGGRAAGIWYAYSTDAGRTWSPPQRVDTNDHTDIWPWLAVGDPGRVAVSWLEAEKQLPNHDAETPGDHGWRVMAAQTLKGLGCDESPLAGFRVATATPDPVHRGTICQGGTVCQAELVDRRMGDYFSIEIDNTGRMYAGYSDTRQGGAVALPGFVRQAGGPTFLKKKSR